MPGGSRGFRRGGSDGHPHFVYRRQALYVDHWYFYLWDDDWGPGFIKLSPYAPYPVWSWCNGHEWVKRQLTKAGVEFSALGRPEKVRLVVDRRINSRTPGRFSTQLITKGVDPTLPIHYKSSKVKAYFKESRALRVETTINNPRDFDVRKTLCAVNWRALRRIGAAVNARFLAAVGEGAPPPPDVTTLESVVLPSSDADGLRAPGLRFGDPRVMALLAALAAFSHVVGGLTNPGLCRLVGDLLGRPYTSRQATYDLRRLRRKGLIERVPDRNLYRVTPHGRAVATFLTKVAARVVVPGLTALEAPASPRAPASRPIVTAWRAWQRELDAFIREAGMAA